LAEGQYFEQLASLQKSDHGNSSHALTSERFVLKKNLVKVQTKKKKLKIKVKVKVSKKEKYLLEQF
jgi:hypothetical protein